MLKKYLPVVAIYALVMSIMYNKEIVAFLKDYVDDMVLRPTMGLITVTLFLYIIKSFWDRYMEVSTDKEKKLAEGFSVLTTDVVTVKTDVGVMRVDLEHVKEEVKKTTVAINDINEYKDDKKRWYKEFDMDWSGMKDAFTDPNECNSEIYCTARMFKETLKHLAVQYHSVDIYDITKKEAMEIFTEKYYAMKDNNILKLKLMLSIDYIDLFVAKQGVNETYLFDELNRILDDSVNKRSEGIQLVMRQFMRRTLNTLYKTWLIYKTESKIEEAPAGTPSKVTFVDIMKDSYSPEAITTSK